MLLLLQLHRLLQLWLQLWLLLLHHPWLLHSWPLCCLQHTLLLLLLTQLRLWTLLLLLLLLTQLRLWTLLLLLPLLPDHQLLFPAPQLRMLRLRLSYKSSMRLLCLLQRCILPCRRISNQHSSLTVVKLTD
jgi:hypothetical protein